MTQYSATNSWLLVVAVAAMVTLRTYLIFTKRRRTLLRVEAKEAAYFAAGGVAFADQPTWQRVSRGGRFAAIVPGGCTIFILIAILIGGRFQQDHGTTIDLLELAVLYFAGSVFLGAAIGFGAPYMRGFVRASFVGIIAVAPLVISGAVSMDEGHWGRFETVLAAGLSVMFGMAIGYGAARGERLRTNAARPKHG